MAAILQGTSVDRFLGTNYVPNDVEIKEIKQCISVPLQSLKAIEEETAILELRLELLRRESANIHASIASHQALLSPIRHLPVDLLREIFIACLPTDRNPTMCSDEAPILITRISSYWRNVALTTPRLWTAIHIPIPQPEFVSTQFLGETKEQEVTRRRSVGVMEFLSRSGSLPLTISIHFSLLWNANPLNGRTTPLLDCIIPLAARWQDITIMGPSYAVSQVCKLQSDFPQLRSLRLDTTQAGIDSEGMLSWKESGLVKAEGLRSFSVTVLNGDVIDFPVRWSQLTDLTLKKDDRFHMSRLISRNIHQILQMSPALISCSLFVQHANVDFNAAFPPVFLKHLEILTIEEPTQCPNFFASFDVPSLKALEYLPKSACTLGPASLLALLSNRSNANRLEKLTTTPRFFDSAEFVDILRHCGSLRLLSLCQPSLFFPQAVQDQGLGPDNPIDDALLHLFAPREGPQTISDIDMSDDDSTDQLCPKLEELIIVTESNVSERAILTFISRKQSINNTHANESNKLKNVDVCFHRPKVDDIMPKLSAFIASGLKVRIRYPPTTLKGQFSLYDGLKCGDEQDPYSVRLGWQW